MCGFRVGRALRLGAGILVAIALLGWLVMALWNWLVPGLWAGAHEIDYGHALGLLILCRVLFGGFRGHGHAVYRGRVEGRGGPCRGLSSEERERLREHAAGAPEAGGAPTP